MSEITILLVVILIAVLLFRGPRTLPMVGRSLGDVVRRVRRHQDDVSRE